MRVQEERERVAREAKAQEEREREVGAHEERREQEREAEAQGVKAQEGHEGEVKAQKRARRKCEFSARREPRVEQTHDMVAQRMVGPS